MSGKRQTDGALVGLLISLFTPDELWLWLQQITTDDIRHYVPTNASMSQIFSDVVEALVRRGMVDSELFRTLIKERPRRKADIEQVARLWGIRVDDSSTSLSHTNQGNQNPVRPALRIDQIFRTTGVPDISFVEPSQLPEITFHLRIPGEGLVVEGASGVGKTTAVRHALQIVLGNTTEVLEATGALTMLSARSTSDQARLQTILAAGARNLKGHLVVDDFHRLPTDLQRSLADLMKVFADDGRDQGKITLIGINPVGDSLTRDFPDLTGRFVSINLNRQPPQKIEELIRRGAEAANITFEQHAQIVYASRGSFYTAQLLCLEIAKLEGIRETLTEHRMLTIPLSIAVDRVRDRLKFKYYSRLVFFASYDQPPPPPRGATLALLWLMAQDFSEGVSLRRAIYRFPALHASLEWLLQSNFSALLHRDAWIGEMLFYNRDAGMLSAEDPQLDFYLNSLSWPALARDSGHIDVEWRPDGTPVFLTSGPPSETTLPPIVSYPSSEKRSNIDMPPAHVLHISDLHFSNPQLALQFYDQLREDLRELAINLLTAVVVSGDIVNRGTRIEYEAAGHFFRELKVGFSLRPQQIVLVPGNHDLDWAVSRSAYKIRRRDEWSGPSEDAWHIEQGSYVEEAQRQDLQRRFQAFADFYADVCGDPYPLEPESQATLRHYPDTRLLFLGLNSCWAIDHHHPGRADIHARALGRALDRIDREPSYRDSLRVAVWHHPISSAEEDRIRDTGFLERLAASGFRLGLHGHIHQAQETLYRLDMAPAGRRLDLLGAGTFGAPTSAWVPGYPLQYQILAFSGAQLTVHTRRREAINGAWRPDARWTQGPGQDPLPRYVIPL